MLAWLLGLSLAPNKVLLAYIFLLDSWINAVVNRSGK